MPKLVFITVSVFPLHLLNFFSLFIQQNIEHLLSSRRCWERELAENIRVAPGQMSGTLLKFNRSSDGGLHMDEASCAKWRVREGYLEEGVFKLVTF